MRGVYLFSEPDQILFLFIGLRKANPRNKIIRRKLLQKEDGVLFYKLQAVPLKEVLQSKSFLMTFAKFWRALLTSCFKEVVTKRKIEWKGSQLINSI